MLFRAVAGDPVQPPQDTPRTVGEIWTLAAEAAEAAAAPSGYEGGWIAALGVVGPLDRLTAVQVAAVLAVIVGRSGGGMGRHVRAAADATVAAELWELPAVGQDGNRG